MNRIVVNSKIGEDGVLHLSLPLGLSEAGHDVQVTIESIPITKAMSPEQWQAWVHSMAGSWKGELQRPEPGDYEARESME